MIIWCLGTPHSWNFSTNPFCFPLAALTKIISKDPSFTLVTALATISSLSLWKCWGGHVLWPYKKLFLSQGVCMTSAKLLSIPGVDSKTLFFWWEREAESLSAIFGPKATGRSAISIIDWTLLLPWHTFFPFHYMNLQGPGQRLLHEGIFPVVRTTLMWGQWFLSPQTPPPPPVSCHDGISDWRNISHCMAAD